MLKRYVVAVFPETGSQFYEYTDNLAEAKDYAKSQAKQGYKAIIFETLYEFDPKNMNEPVEENKVYSEPWGWIR